jgi:hypothetical protein
MYGDAVARKRKEYNEINIILISANDLDDDFVNELKENNYIAKYIEKPIHLTNLIDLVANTIHYLNHFASKTCRRIGSERSINMLRAFIFKTLSCASSLFLNEPFIRNLCDHWLPVLDIMASYRAKYRGAMPSNPHCATAIFSITSYTHILILYQSRLGIFSEEKS